MKQINALSLDAPTQSLTEREDIDKTTGVREEVTAQLTGVQSFRWSLL
jgi:hypothetical protein